MLCWNKALCLVVPSHMAIFNQSDGIISAYATLKFANGIGSWIDREVVSLMPYACCSHIHLMWFILNCPNLTNIIFLIEISWTTCSMQTADGMKLVKQSWFIRWWRKRVSWCSVQYITNRWIYSFKVIAKNGSNVAKKKKEVAAPEIFFPNCFATFLRDFVCFNKSLCTNEGGAQL